MIENKLFNWLIAHPGVMAFIGTRLFPLVAPEGVAKPFCTYQKISNARAYTFSKTSPVSRARIQLDCWGDSYSQVKGLASEISTALEAWDSTEILTAQQQNESDGYEPDTKLFRVSVDFFIWE